MIVIELLSYIIRSFSLAIRLSANILAGHTLVHIIASVTSFLFNAKTIMAFLPFSLLIAILILELGVACLQAYIFVILVSMYLNDSLNFHSH
jgi:ATP synthase subunit 6